MAIDNFILGLSQLTQSFGGGSNGAGGFPGGQLSCNGGGQGNYGYGPVTGGQHSNWIHDRDVHNLIENVSKGEKG